MRDNRYDTRGGSGFGGQSKGGRGGSSGGRSSAGGARGRDSGFEIEFGPESLPTTKLFEKGQQVAEISGDYSGKFGGGSSGGGRFGGGGGSRGEGNAGSRLKPIDWSKERLATIQKSFYVECASVTRRDQHEIDAWIAENQVTLDGRNIPRPVFEFNEANGFPPELVDLLYGKFQHPTIIQSISWPIAMSGRDIVSIAKTGSGKTLAFMLPGLIHIIKQAPRGRMDGPSVLVMLPTRELAQQVQEVSIDFCNVLGLKMACLFGGAPKGGQARELERGVDIVVATPGRLLDFLEAGTTNMKRCSYLVLDEADRMLDMGFEPQIRKIIGQIRPDRQTLMFSATWPKEVRALAADFQRDAAFLNVGSLELAANHNITQVIEVMDEQQKQHRLMSLLNSIMNQPECKTIIFVETKRKADELTRWMRRDGWPTLCIHGDKNQAERDWVMNEFKAGKTPILLATDVAARGLDVDDIKFVINYDYPNNSEDYVHRIGRTGRRDKKGTAYTFFTPQNAPKARDLIKVLEEAHQTVSPMLRDLSNRGGSGGSRGRWGNSGGRNGSAGGKRPYPGGGNSGGGSYGDFKKPRYENGYGHAPASNGYSAANRGGGASNNGFYPPPPPPNGW
ncbi:hypothetical protein WR25_05417 [Diploscapter pachys]|uniref:RNA helicase n=1 Tax=Diploscapter pachys TaxID=2018661 RepID=A0A2A2KA63_9BILA|nr:hypothetical protein WR25_05417 [Diploscapter pachys]